MSLDHGVMTEMLRLPTKGGRAEAPMTHHIIKGAAVYTVRRLRATGMKAGDANAAVCRILVEEQIEPARKGAYGMGVMRPSTIANWVNKSADGSREWAPVVAFHLNEFLSKRVAAALGLIDVPNGIDADEFLRHLVPLQDLRNAYLAGLKALAGELRCLP
jgi:hypothetical protein